MSYPKERIMLLQVVISCQIKSPVPGEVYVYSTGWLEVDRTPQDHVEYCCYSWLPTSSGW